MPVFHRITDADDPRLEPFRHVRERDLVGRQGRFVLEGVVVIRQALRAGRVGLEGLLLAPAPAAALADVVAALPDSVPVYETTQAIIEQVAGFPLHRGALALGLLPERPSASGLLETLRPPALVLGCVGIANHDSMGALFRNAAAFGAAAVLLDATCCDPLYRKAIRVSVGAALTVPFARVASGDAMLELLAAHGFSAVALSPGAALPVGALRPARRTALVVGAEGSGLPASMLARARAVRIPMAPGWDSLNVATAAAVVLHHVARRQSR